MVVVLYLSVVLWYAICYLTALWMVIVWVFTTDILDLAVGRYVLCILDSEQRLS